MRLSIVTTVYRTARFLERFVAEASNAAEECGFDSYEIVAVVDGSPDDAIPVLRELKQRFPQLRVIELSRNFGHHPALRCGMEQAQGELVFLADSDCETPPRVLSELHKRRFQSDADVAYACRRGRKEALPLCVISKLFWGIFGVLSDVRIPRDILTERLMTRRYVKALLALEERNLFLAGVMHWIGFRQVAVLVDRSVRSGSSSYSWSRRAALAVDAITSFSVRPLQLLFAAGCVLSCGALAAACALACWKLLHPAAILGGFTALAVLLLFSLGVILAAIGLVGLYLGKVFVEAKRRPLYIVREEF